MANLLYVDQPAGTGFSYVTSPFGYVTNEREIATELWDFIRQFYSLYPKYSMLDLYVFGESYGELTGLGVFLPACLSNSTPFTCLLYVRNLNIVICIPNV